MTKKYLIIDGMNLYFRSAHVSTRGADLEERVSYSLHVTLQSIAASFRDQQADHVVFCLEGKSWRRDFYPPYKANRDVKRQAQTVKEEKENAAFYDGFKQLIKFLSENTNITMLQHPKLEGDDLIAGWIQTHPHDTHVIGSSDSDFYQLLAENVTQYNGVTRELHTINGIFDYKGKPVIDKKTKLPKTIPDPKFILFEKCMRGDPGDNVFSAYPGVRMKGSAKTVGLLEAYEDRDNKGYAWNNVMLSRWVDHDKVEHRVMDDFARNITLIDLTAQPVEVRAFIDETIKAESTAKNRQMVGAKFLKFCGHHNLVKLSEQAATYGAMLSAAYPEGELI